MTRFRSPRYPFLDLQAGVEAVRKLHAAAPVGRLQVEAAPEAWGKRADSSAVVQTIAALRQFGLIAVESDGDKRMLVLTERAERLLDRSDDTDALQQAARSPKVFDKLCEQVQGGPTNRASLMQWLMNEQFSAKAAGHVLQVFQATMKFAGLAVGELGARLEKIQNETSIVEEVIAPGAIRILFPRPPTGRDYELLQAYIDDKQPRNVGEEAFAIGKIRIQYRGEPERKDFQQARDHFERELKG